MSVATNNLRAVRGPVTAIPVVAGNGVRFVEDTQNNRVIAEVDETVLWESSSSTGETNSSSSAARVLSEPVNNFERIAIYDSSWNNTGCAFTRNEFAVNTNTQTFGTSDSWADYSYNPASTNSHYSGWTFYTLGTDHKTLTTRGVYRKHMGSNGAPDTATGYILKVVGINRISS